MAGNVGSPPAECPSCAAGGIRSSVKLYQINLEQAAVFCENASCPFPLFSQDVCPLVVSHAAAPGPAANSKFKTRSMDTESMTSTCSVSSWTSHASTLSSVSSNVATPPPSISSKPFIWPSNQYSVYQPKAMAPKQKNVFDWITPISSSQSSPASSVISFNDKEVEMVMGKSANLTPNSGLPPSPSPTLSDILDAVGNQPSESNDSYFESLCSFLDEGTEAPTPSYSSPLTEETTLMTTEFIDVQQAAEPIALQFPEASTPVRQSTKRVVDDNGSNESGSKLTKSSNSTPESIAAWRNIELPLKKSSVREKKPRTSAVAKTRVSRSASSSNESMPPSTPIPQPLVPQSTIAVELNDEGNHVFTIHPVTRAPSVTPKPRSSAKTVKATASAVRPSKTSKPSKAATAKPAEPAEPKRSSKKKDPFCVQSLVEKFIEAAKNKKLASPKNP
ncbi:flocculation protein FLO11 [Daphnia magna]|uniref:flocculation protein FLO11 n=1 Tax=Daphnia magna TaxID=35525 RepID=UPI001E1BD9D2|nr:flocculation protein FLO11 [Daphnia magna]